LKKVNKSKQNFALILETIKINNHIKIKWDVAIIFQFDWTIFKPKFMNLFIWHQVKMLTLKGLQNRSSFIKGIKISWIFFFCVEVDKHGFKILVLFPYHWLHVIKIRVDIFFSMVLTCVLINHMVTSCQV